MEVDELDKALELATVVRGGEFGFVRDYRQGHAFGKDADRQRMDAFTLGMLDVLAEKIVGDNGGLPLFAYLFSLLEFGPGTRVRRAYRELIALAAEPALVRYLAGGRRHVMQTLAGKSPPAGRFAALLEEELCDR